MLDQQQALDFYKKLGFKVHTDAVMPDGFRWLTICLPGQEDVEIALMPAVEEEEIDLVGNQAAHVPLFAFAVEDAQKTFQDLRRHSVEVVQEPTERPWGIETLVTDLYGNVLCLVQAKG